MQKLILILSVVTASALGGCNRGDSGARPSVTTEDEKTLYALGRMVGRNVGSFNLSPHELEIVKAGLSDQVLGKKSIVEIETYGPKLQTLVRSRAGQKAQAEKEKAKGFQDAAAKEPGALKETSGLVYVPIKEGSGEHPKSTDSVKVHYEGKLTDGTIFDSSVQRGQPAEFSLSSVIPCWTEGMQKLKVGGKAKLVCPSTIAYGDSGRPPKIPGGATLVFEVELLEIKAPAVAPPGGLNLSGGGMNLPAGMNGIKLPPGMVGGPPPAPPAKPAIDSPAKK